MTEIELGILGLIVAILIGYLGLRYQKKALSISERELKLNEQTANAELPTAEILIFGEASVDSIVYVIPFDRRTLFSVPLDIGLRNNAKIEFRNLMVFLRVNADVYGHEYVTRKPGQMAQAFGFERFEEREDGTKVIVVLSKLARVPPELTYSLQENLFTSSSTIIEDVVEGESSDGAKLRMPFKLVVTLDLTITVQGENVGSSSKSLSISFLPPPEKSIEDHFREKYGSSVSPEQHGKTAIVSFKDQKESKEFSEMTIELKRDLELYQRDKAAGLKALRKHHGGEVSDDDLIRIIEHGVRERLVNLTKKEVAFMNVRYP